MGAARYWDDPEADLEETIDLPVPGDVRAGFEPRPTAYAILREVIDAIRLVGTLLAVFGGPVAWLLVPRGGAAPLRVVGLIAGLVVIPGVLYLVAAAGLMRRRYWAWTMGLIVTVLLMLTLLGLGVYFVAFSSRPEAVGFVVPTAIYFSMPVLILLYMVRALPVIRDAELLVRTGFNVLPAAPALPDRARLRRSIPVPFPPADRASGDGPSGSPDAIAPDTPAPPHPA